MMSAREKHRASAAAMAAQDYENHEISKLPDGRWRCSRRDSGLYRFYVLFFPGTVIIYGDIGDLILNHSDMDSIRWAMGAVNSIDYALGKAPESMRRKDAVDGMVVEALHWWRVRISDSGDSKKEMKEEREKLRELIEKLRHREVGDRDSFNAAYYEITGDFEPPEVGDWSADAQRCFHALRWLVKSKGEELRA